jgi:hypothetical protein
MDRKEKEARPMETPALAPAPAPKAPFGAPRPRLPRSFEQVLEWLDPKDYGKVETLICSMPSTREMVLVARFLDQTWNQARNAEYRIGAGRISGAEMDAFYDRWKAALGELVKIGVELGRRAGLTEILQRHKKVLAHFGYETSGRKSGGERTPSPAKPPAAPKVPAPAAVSAA